MLAHFRHRQTCTSPLYIDHQNYRWTSHPLLEYSSVPSLRASLLLLKPQLKLMSNISILQTWHLWWWRLYDVSIWLSTSSTFVRNGIQYHHKENVYLTFNLIQNCSKSNWFKIGLLGYTLNLDLSSSIQIWIYSNTKFEFTYKVELGKLNHWKNCYK